MTIFHKHIGHTLKVFFAIITVSAVNVIALGDTIPNYDIQIVFENRPSADSIIALYPEMKFERVIPQALNPEIETRHRNSGIDLWYIAKMPSKAMSRSTNIFDKTLGIRGIFETQLITLPEESNAVMDSKPLQPQSSSTYRATTTMSDPLYPRQWHYDLINLENAWKLEQGKRNVIVAVMDQWIDHSHPDLAPNMWVNEAELNGLLGVDDDGNGYVDDVYGYNTSTDADYAGAHGTHVAGTVAAVNNNGIGVCGVAGGNGIDTGVKLMSIGVMNAGQHIPDWLMARGFIYAADNGAVISQNSWEGGSSHQNPILNEAINYFMEYAGNRPDSPMKGGLVIFAAGNDNSDIPHYPVNGQSFNRNRFITVGAISADKIRSSFSNYGWWVDVAAPGGEQNGTSIMSTSTNGGYMLMNGTSMACPHVSGVAALIVSKFESPELKPEFVKNRIISTATPIECYQAGYKHATETSLGIVNAYTALCDKNDVGPGIPDEFDVKLYEDSNGLFSWIMPADNNGNAPSLCKIYVENQDIPYAIVKTSGAKVGERFKYFDNSGYISNHNEYTIEAIDCDGNASGRSTISTIKDYTQELAIINPYNIDNFVIYKPSKYGFSESFDDVVLNFNINCDGIKIVEIESPCDFIKSSLLLGNCEITFDVNDTTPTGTFPFTIKVYKKGYPDNVELLPLTCTIKDALCRNNGPISTSGSKTLAVIETTELNGSISLDLSKYITHPWNSNFIICDNSNTIEDDFWGYTINYNLTDGILNADYDFSEAFGSCSANINIDAIDEYMIKSSFEVEILFNDESAAVENVTPDTMQYKTGIYTIYGVKLDCEIKDLLPGIYIINGKKTFINYK